jgi:hypothetical protein
LKYLSIVNMHFPKVIFSISSMREKSSPCERHECNSYIEISLICHSFVWINDVKYSLVNKLFFWWCISV